MGAGPPYGNKNAEKWTFKKAIQLFKESIDLTTKRELIQINGNKVNGYEFDFIGEIAGELGTFKQIFGHLLKRFPTLQGLNNQLHTNIERNCYYNGKKGAIKEASSIMNLKSNHRWTDRLDATTDDKPISNINLTDKQVTDILKSLD